MTFFFRSIVVTTFICAISLQLRAQVPVNDECGSALEIIVNGGPVDVSNSNTLLDGPTPSCGGAGIKDVWYYFTYVSGDITISTTLGGTLTDTRLAVYDACGGIELACNDDNGGFQSLITLSCENLTANAVYYIQAGGYQALSGTFALSVNSVGIVGCTDTEADNYDPCATLDDGTCSTADAPVNDLCENAIPIAIGESIFTNNTQATPSAFNPTCGNGNGTMMDIWYAFVHDGTAIDINVSAGTLTDTRLVVYGTCGGAQLGCDDDSGPGNAAFLHFDCGDLVNGETYLLRVGGYASNVGTFTVNITSTGTCNFGDNCDVPLIAAMGNNVAPHPNSWYAFTPEESGQYRITTCNLNTCDTKIWIYDYCNMANFDDSNEATYTYNDDFCGVQAEITPLLGAGQTYYLRIGDTDNACLDAEISFLIEYMGPAVGCMDILACNFSPIATVEGPCYYNDDPNCSGLGPDLEVNGSALFTSLYNTTINGTDACLVNEGCLQGLGERQILRFSTHIKNIGTQDYFIGVPSADNEQFEWDECHNHYHYEGYAEYLLFDVFGNPMPQIGFKNGFCVLDLECSGGGIAKYGCGNMGITAGCGDIYGSSLSCQWIDITDVPDGDYFLVVRTNWDQDPDNAGHYETQYDNNWAQVCIHFERDIDGNIINFTKDINSCEPIVDCLGQPFGDVYPDCAGNCPGVSVRGDVVEEDGGLTEEDVHEYLHSTIEGEIAVSPCTDLNNDGMISVADAVMLESCIHGQEEQGIPAAEMTDCPYDNEVVNPNHLTTLYVGEINTELQYVDIQISNPERELRGLEFIVSGIAIDSIEMLDNASTWETEIAFEEEGHHVSIIGHDPSYLDKFMVPTSVIRLHYSATEGTEVCIAEIIDAVNLDNHNTLTAIGPCLVIPTDPEECIGDFDDNGVVGISDLTLIIGAFGCVNNCGEMDLDGDGLVGMSDMQIFIAWMDTVCP